MNLKKEHTVGTNSGGPAGRTHDDPAVLTIWHWRLLPEKRTNVEKGRSPCTYGCG